MKIGILLDIFDSSKNPVDYYYFSQIISKLDHRENDIVLFSQNVFGDRTFLDIVFKNWAVADKNSIFVSMLDQIENEEFDIIFFSSGLSISQQLIRFKDSGIGLQTTELYVHLVDEFNEHGNFYDDLTNPSIHILSHVSKLKKGFGNASTHFLPFPIKKNFEPVAIKKFFSNGVKIVFPLTSVDTRLVYDTALRLHEHRWQLDSITHNKGICFHFMLLNESTDIQSKQLKTLIEHSPFKDITTIEHVADLSLKNISSEKEAVFIFTASDAISSLHFFECLLNGAPTFIFENNPLKQYLDPINSKEFILSLKGWLAAEQILRVVGFGIQRPSLASHYLASRKYWSEFITSLKVNSTKAIKQISKGTQPKFAIIASDGPGLDETVDSILNCFGPSAQLLIFQLGPSFNGAVTSRKLQTVSAKNVTFFSNNNFADVDAHISKTDKVFLLKAGDRLNEEVVSRLKFDSQLLAKSDALIFGYSSRQNFYLPPICDENEDWLLIGALNNYPALLKGSFFLNYMKNIVLEVPYAKPMEFIKWKSVPISVLEFSFRMPPKLNKRIISQVVANAFYSQLGKARIDMRNFNSFYLGIKSQESDS